jgi:hypothetical protein
MISADFEMHWNVNFGREFKGKTGPAFAKIIHDTKTEAKNTAPVDTGALKRGIDDQVDGSRLRGKVFTTDGKGGFVERGRKRGRHGRMAGRRFISRAARTVGKRSAAIHFAGIFK